ncbi:MAG: hypothetical protein IT449_18565 [Phycisphaerales bacterium]|nr:hypothetical protein [Phycisphaerales bacterium]
MNWLDDARALDQRIRGLVEAGTFFIATLALNSEDAYAVSDRYLSPEARRIFEEVVAFHQRYADVLPSAASNAIDRFIDAAKPLMTGGDVKKLEGLKARLAPLAAFRAELAYHLSDREAVSRRMSERAFQHLQRRIIADPTEQARWTEAFKQGETACEKLGAVHLLSHGLWGFKISAAGEATDLIFAELIDGAVVQSAAEALVLTEWKLVRQGSQAASQAEHAHRQASRYARGVLGGLELHGYRYLVLVSKDFLHPPEDFTEDNVRYRHINIAVAPKSPSKG